MEVPHGLRYESIHLDENYDEKSMDLEKFESSMLSGALMHGGVVVWEELLNSREDEGDFQKTLIQFKENCEFLGIWKYMTSNPESFDVKNLALFLNFAEFDKEKTRIFSRIGDTKMLVDKAKLKEIFGFVDRKSVV